MTDLAVVDMGEHEEVFATLQEVRGRGDPYWWLYAVGCAVCGQGWLVAQEERQNDIFCLKRLSEASMSEIVDHNRWPGDFDHYEALLEIGLGAGKSVSWVDPRDSSLLPTIIDLARDRPGIRISEIVRLLSLDQATAEALSRAAVHQARVTICTESGDVIS